jgi:hypothetical protein
MILRIIWGGWRCHDFHTEWAPASHGYRGCLSLGPVCFDVWGNTALTFKSPVSDKQQIQGGLTAFNARPNGTRCRRPRSRPSTALAPIERSSGQADLHGRLRSIDGAIRRVGLSPTSPPPPSARDLDLPLREAAPPSCCAHHARPEDHHGHNPLVGLRSGGPLRPAAGLVVRCEAACWCSRRKPVREQKKSPAPWPGSATSFRTRI